MTLRIMLVGLVASLGFELPSGSDVSRWAQAGTAWVQARMLDRSGPEIGCKPELAEPSDCQQVVEKIEVPALVAEAEAVSDAAFQVAAERVTVDLAADLVASHRDETPVVEVAPKLALEAPAPVGLPEGEEAGCLVVNADEARTVEVALPDEPSPADPVDSTVGSPERLDRVSSAVRLTREAFNAWAAVMQQYAEEGQPSR
jgi:hypothetical protein